MNQLRKSWPAQLSVAVQLIAAQRALDDAMIRGDPDDLIETQVALVADLQQQVALVRVAGQRDDSNRSDRSG